MTLILFPLKKEMDFFLKACAQLQIKYNENVKFNRKVFSTLDNTFLITTCGHGKAETAANTSRYLTSDSFSGAILMGSAGALDSRCRVGDVVLGENTIEHDYRVKFGNPSVPMFKGDVVLLNKFQTLSLESFKVFKGNIASGDEDITDLESVARVKSTTSALAVAWEGAGFKRATRLCGVPSLEIRVITDLADAHTLDSFEKNLALAMQNLAILLKQNFFK